jgi:hypothetical protein
MTVILKAMNAQSAIPRLARRLLWLALLLVACAPGASEEAQTPATASESRPTIAIAQPTAEPEAIASASPDLPAATEPALATEAPADGLTATQAAVTPTEESVVVNGRAAEGIFFRGRADAPVVIYDYSDFL